MHTRQISQITEEYAAFFLVSLGHEILDQNYSSAAGELDLITYKDSVFHFVETKSRNQRGFLAPEEALTDEKLEKIELTALAFLQDSTETWQIDFVAISYDDKLQVEKIDLFEDVNSL